GARSRRSRGPRHPSRQALLLAAGEAHQARSRALLPVNRAGRARWNPRSPAGAEALCRWRRGRGVLPEAGALRAPRVAQNRDACLSLRTHGGGTSGRRCGGLGLRREPRLHRTASPSRAHRQSRLSRRAPHRSRSHAGRRLGRSPPFALEVRALLEEVGLRGWPKTSGSRGMHVYAPIWPRWTFTEVRRAALAFSREIERRMPNLATSKWWKEERRGVFLDYNQNAKDRTTCSAYSVRPQPDARVSAPLAWEEVPECEPADFTVSTMPGRFAAIGDPHAGIDAAAGSLEKLLEHAARDQADGLGDAPWPPHFRKTEGEGVRVAPSRAKGAARKPRARMPLVVVANSPDKEAALAGLERWKGRHPEAARYLAVDDVLVDSMRGRFSTWTRIRVNLRGVPEAIRPVQETPDPDDDPTREWRAQGPKQR